MAGVDSRLVSVVIPTRNEAGNIGPLVRRISDAASDVVEEIVFVDDSDDKTPQVIERVATGSPLPVRLIHRRSGERDGGLGGAVVEGIVGAKSDFVLVMDGDLQHPPEVIPDVVAAMNEHSADVAIASRRHAGTRAANAGPFRRFVTSLASNVTKAAFPRRLAGITDPLTGFFLVDRRRIPEGLRPDGFKILLEILVAGDRLKAVEVGFDFGDRVSGRSKASLEEGVRFVKLIARLRMSTRRRRRRERRESGSGLDHRYDIHGVITIASEARLPELEWFRTNDELVTPDITVRLGKPKGGSTEGLEYTEQLGWAGFAVRIEGEEQLDIHASRLVGRSPHVLYTNIVEPVLRWEFVRRGYALVHSACVVHDGHAYLVTARTDTGKTTTALKLLEAGDLEFLSDDLCLVTPEGGLLAYPKPMTLSYHTVQAVNPKALSFKEKLALQPQSRLHSRSGRRIGLGLAQTKFPAATANAVVQAIIPPPKYSIDRILPHVSTAPMAEPTHVFVIAKGHESKRRLYSEESMEMVLANCEDAYGFPPYDRVEAHMLGRSEVDLREVEADVILNALLGRPATLLQSDDYAWADQIRLEVEADDAIAAATAGNGQAGADDTDGLDTLVDFTFDGLDRSAGVEEAGTPGS